MKRIVFNEAEIYSADTTDVALTDANQATIRKAIQMNHAVGFLTGYYDEPLTITYFIGTVFSAALYFLLNRGSADLVQEWKSLNWTPYVLGFIVVAMEAGNVYAYRAGWSVNTLPVVQAACVAVLLLVLGFLLYREAITVNKLIGLALCLVGLFFLNK